MKFGCSWRKISRKSECGKDSESTLQGRTVKNVNFNRIGSWDHGSSSGSPAQGKRQRVWDVHCDGGGVVSLFLCGGKAGSDSENTSDDGILHRDQSSVFVGAFENGGNHLYCRICKDAGYGSLGTQIEIFAKLSILAVSMPILLALLETVKQFLA